MNLKRQLSLTIAIITSFGLLSTILGTILDNPDSPFLSAAGTIKYFTIQSNLLIAIFFWLLFFLQDNHKWLNSTILGGISIYITITFLGYAIFLEGIYDPEGIALVGTIINHYITPLLVIAFVILFRKEYYYRKEMIKKWLIYPLLYLVFFIMYGLITSDYFYPFLDFNSLGILWFFISVTGIIIIFLVLSCSLIFMSKSKRV